ncbi:MAG: prenyltransferase/squalene oxidase repeat-containing protein [Planctomycetota bacterium]
MKWSALALALLFAVPGAAAAERTPTELARVVRQAPRSPEASAAIEELGRRGIPGWRALANLVRDLSRKDTVAARRAVRTLAAGDEEGRRKALRGTYSTTRATEVRVALLTALARWYPVDSTLLHAALRDDRLPERGALFDELIRKGLVPEVIRACLREEQLAMRAYDELVRRGVSPDMEELTVVALSAARQGFRRRFAWHFAKRLKRGGHWNLVRGIAALVGGKDEAASRGAHVLLLTVSGKDIIPDRDLWVSWIAARQDRYEIPREDSDGAVAAAVLRGVDYLREDLLADGASVYKRAPQYPEYTTGATALTILALRAAGVPKDDPAIVKALETSILKEDVGGEWILHPQPVHGTYVISLVAMALAELDREEHRHRIQSLANRLAAGQLDSGQWTYRCGYRYKARVESSRRFGDNSNTQYAILGLRAAAKAGAEIQPHVWMRAMTFWLGCQQWDGGWGYGHRLRSGRERSMTPAGIASVAICMEGLYGRKAARRIMSQESIRRGLVRQGELLIHRGYLNVDHYTFYGVERACVLTGTRLFNDYDWYRAGARDLLRRQDDDGSWRKTGGINWEYGPAIDTAYAVLFLKRATTPVAGQRKDGIVVVPRAARQGSRTRRSSDTRQSQKGQ